MEHRLGRTLRVFLVVLGAAGFYRLAVVPWVEPRVRDVASDLELSPEQAAAIRARDGKRLAKFGHVFPQGAWELEAIVLEGRQTGLFFKDYHSLPDGRVHLVPCTLVVLPDRNRGAAGGGSGRTIVLHAPQGAALEFDEPLDLRQGRLAKLIGGNLRGQVTIRGTPTAPGAEDDIEIVTRDIELDELEVRTSEMVQFRYGRSSGSGRALVARLRPRPTAGAAAGAAADRGPNIGGVDSIRIDRDLRMRLEGFAGGLLPGREAAAGSDAAPVLVSCRGAMCLNVAANVITLEERVEVVRAAADGATDQLACDLLAIILARREPAAGAAAAAGSGRGGLEPVEIQAKGSPVVATSSGAALEARAERLGYEIATRRILLDGEQPASLVAGDTEMEARKIDYCPGPPGDPGALMAVGPGWLRTKSEKSPPTQARWQHWLRMRPDGVEHVASLSGNAEVSVEGRGRLSGAEMHLWLDVVKQPNAGQPRPAASAGPDLSRVRPVRMLARGMVEADAPQVAARTDRLELWFTTEPAPAAAPAVAAAAPPPAVAATPGPRGAREAPAPATPDRRLTAQAGLVRGRVIIGPQGGRLEDLSMEGQVHLVEQPAAGAAAEPGVEIRGEQLQLSRADQFDALAIVKGRPARVTGKGLELEGPLVEFDRGRNRMTVDGAGRLALPLGAGGSGLEAFGFTGPRAAPAPAAAGGPPGKLDVTWQGRLDFDGLTARFVDQVVAKTDATTVRSGSLDVVFDRPFEFGAAPRGGRQPDVVRVACGSKVWIENRSVQEDGGRSVEQLFVRDLVVDRLTGDVTGTGPGRLTSTRLGQPPALNLPAGAPRPGGVPARPVAAPRQADELTYLGVDFQRGMRGNLNRRVMEFHQRVEAIHGPVADWAATLDPHAAGGLPAGVVRIASDILSVGQAAAAPGADRSTFELGAGGNVLVEGESFTARSARLTWSQAKDLLVFEGDGRADAQLFRQLKPGAQPDSMASEKILFWIRQNRADVEGVRYLDIDRLPGNGPAPGLPGPGRPGRGKPEPPTPLAPRPLPGT
jgi:hypothetical protein